MLQLDDQLKDFDQLMKQKGYDGYFLSNFGFPDRLPETIRKHIFQCYTTNRDLNPIRLTTYSDWVNDERPYIKCTFSVDYDEDKGFRVKNIDIEHANTYGAIRQSKIALLKNEDIPNRDAVNKLALTQKKNRLSM